MRSPEHSSQVSPPSHPFQSSRRRERFPGTGSAEGGDELVSCSAVKSQACHSWQLSRGDIPAAELVGGSVCFLGSRDLLWSCPLVLPSGPPLPHSLRDALRGNPASISGQTLLPPMTPVQNSGDGTVLTALHFPAGILFQAC